MKTYSVHILHRKDPITVLAEAVVWQDGVVDFYSGDECVAEFQRANVAGVVVAGDDEVKVVVQ